MTGDTIKYATEEAFKITGKKPQSIQSDNGSCYISQEYKTCISKFRVEPRYIHPHCPNENAEIERYHRTVRELLDPHDVENFDSLHKLIKEQVDYYNHERYHSALGFITPFIKYKVYRKSREDIYSKNKKIIKSKRKTI